MKNLQLISTSYRIRDLAEVGFAFGRRIKGFSIDIRPTADGTVDIQTRLSNACGCSQWRSRTFDIGRGGGGSTGTPPGLEW